MAKDVFMGSFIAARRVAVKPHIPMERAPMRPQPRSERFY